MSGLTQCGVSTIIDPFREHWTNGGTAITNFDGSLREIYEAAIRACGETRLVIHDMPFGLGTSGSMSLHYISTPHDDGDISSFWHVVDRLIAEREAA